MAIPLQRNRLPARVVLMAAPDQFAVIFEFIMNVNITFAACKY